MTYSLTEGDVRKARRGVRLLGDTLLAAGAVEVYPGVPGFDPVVTDPAQMARQAGRLDLVIDTVAAPHVLDGYLATLKLDGTMCLVGAPSEPHPAPNVFGLIFRRRRLAGSMIGGIAETQEMLDFCAERGIVSDIETIRMDYIEQAYTRILKSDVKYRFVIDLKTMGG